jgi:hypothetical protein
LYEIIYIILYIILLRILTFAIFLFSTNGVNNNSKNDKEEEEEDEEDESYKGEANSNGRKSIGSFVCEGQEIVTNVGGNCHIHVVMNHNRQEEMMATNFTGLTSHLAFFYDPPLGPFSKFVYVN